MGNSKNIFSTLVLEQNPSYVEELEKKYNIELPPIFKAFCQTFKYGKFNPSPKHDIEHTNDDIGYTGIELNLEECILVGLDEPEMYVDLNLFPIIVSGYYHFGICLGFGKDNADQILLYQDHDNLALVANNILEFIRQLNETPW
ncbi:MAG: SMI1/KNR4 family protein [Cyclobacteriaceae bacterium]